LRIEPRLDRELAQKALAERMDGLRSQRLDARNLRHAGAAVGVALAGRNAEEGSGRIDRPGDLFAIFESLRQLGQRLMNAIGDLARCFFGEGDQHDALRQQRLVAQQQLQHLGHDGRGLACSRSRFDDDVAPFRFAELKR